MSDPKPFEAVRDYGRQHMGWPEGADEQPVDVKAETKVNYVTNAENLLGAEWRNGDMAVAQLTEAQVYATLALVEQQRTANLIAFQALTGEKYLRETRASLGLTS